MSVPAGEAPDYGAVEYWNERYVKERQRGPDHFFDWYCTYGEMKQMLAPYMRRGDRILVPGCGNSTLGRDLYRDGFRDVTCIDISRVCVVMMEERLRTLSGVTFLTADVRLIEDLEDASFDVIIEKGLMDALLAGSAADRDVPAMNEELCRLLKPGGYFLSVTYGEPATRMPYLQRPQYMWNVDHAVMAFSVALHLYAMRKDEGGHSTGATLMSSPMVQKKQQVAAERAAALLSAAVGTFDAPNLRGYRPEGGAGGAASSNEDAAFQDEWQALEDEELEGVAEEDMDVAQLRQHCARTGGPPEYELRSVEREVGEVSERVEKLVDRGAALREDDSDDEIHRQA